MSESVRQEGMMMARKPNYEFERRERERQRAEKKALRAAAKKEAKRAKSELAQPPGAGTEGPPPEC
jgi:hypothetical protein